MDLVAHTLKDVFENIGYKKGKRSFSAFMFVLITPADGDMFLDFLSSVRDINYLSGNEVLVIAPSIAWHNNSKLTVEELASLRTRPEPWIQQKYNEFMERQTQETYDLCKHIGLPASELPCLVIFDTLDSPDHFVSIRLLKQNGSSLGSNLRHAIALMDDSCLWSKRRYLDSIRQDLHAEVPSTIKNRGTYEQVNRQRNELEAMRRRISRAKVAREPGLDRRYRAAAADLKSAIELEISPSFLIERSPQFLGRLVDGLYDPKALDHVRMIKKNAGKRISQECLQAFDNFFVAADDYFRKERLEDRRRECEARLRISGTQLELEILKMREQLENEAYEIEKELSNASRQPTRVLAELPSARLWRISNYHPSSWLTLEENSQCNESTTPLARGDELMENILFAAANPKGIGQLRLDEEAREIEEGLRRAKKRDRFRLNQRWALRPADLRRALLDVEPTILHFSGHGSGQDGLVLEDESGAPHFVSSSALEELFSLFQDRIRCVVLNACYSEEQAKAISKHIPVVIGMSTAIGDKAAIAFALGFYDALGGGRSYQDAFRFGRNAISMMNIPEHLTPQIHLSKMTASGDKVKTT